MQIKVDEDSNRPLKKRRMTRTVSINTVLQRVGSKEALLADVVGTAPQTVQEIIPQLPSSKARLLFCVQYWLLTFTLDLCCITANP